MRYRKLDANGDYVFGHGVTDFLIDSPDTVRQSVQTRLGLLTGEWFLDKTEGTPWMEEILGKGTNKTHDLVLQFRILQTDGVTSIIQYQSNVDPITRPLSVACLINTRFSIEPVLVEVTL